MPPINPATDAGVGSLNSAGGVSWSNFIHQLGAIGIVDLPAGKLKPYTKSPYDTTANSRNILSIDLEQLQPELIPANTLEALYQNNPNKGLNRVAFANDYIFKAYDQILRVAFNSFSQLPAHHKLKNDFKLFCAKNDADWLESDALYEALSIEKKNDYFPSWESKTDQTLFDPHNTSQEKATRINQLRMQPDIADEKAFYKFCQFIADQQHQNSVKSLHAKGMKIYGDRPIAFSDRDVWANPHFFLPLNSYRLGVAPDSFSETGQAWGFYVLDPWALVDENTGELKRGTHDAPNYLKNMYKRLLTMYPDGIRFDHVIGLIDPYVYPYDKHPTDATAGRLFDLEPYKKHRKKLTNAMIDIILEAINEHATANQLDAKQLINQCILEDLGTMPQSVIDVMKRKDLHGLRVTQFINQENPSEDPESRALSANPHVVMSTGTHDNVSLRAYAKQLFDSNYKAFHNIAWQLAQDTGLTLPNEEISWEADKLRHFLTAQFVQLILSPAKRIQVMFTDLLGMDDIFNQPSKDAQSADVWTLRIPQNFKELYADNLAKGFGFNVPAALVQAFEQKGNDFKTAHAAVFKRLQKLHSELQNALAERTKNQPS